MREPQELTGAECVDLLAAGVFGRVAIATPVGPRIVPLNYTVLDDAIVLRTTPYSELASYGPGGEAAFEIDNVDYSRQTGWSVVAFGRLERVDPSELDDLERAWVPRPWAGGPRNLYLKLTWREVSGRRIGAESQPIGTQVPVRRAL
jgi:uncharacterized protein